MPVLPYLRLMRPANILTAIADILLGYAVSGGVAAALDSAYLPALRQPETLAWLVLATIGLYGGGVVLNDAFDADLDRRERPERPIPSGAVSERAAFLFGMLLLLGGVAAAAQVSARSALLAALVAALAAVYDAYGKHHDALGPFNMSACRSGNVLLGMSAAPLPAIGWAVALAPFLYIAAVTMISRGEVGGGNQRALRRGLVLYGAVFLLIAVVHAGAGGAWPSLLFFLSLFAGFVLPPLQQALRTPSGPVIGRAVKAGVLGLVAMDAALAVPFAGWPYALLILALLPLSIAVARFFAVT